jgi:hypothetical protein
MRRLGTLYTVELWLSVAGSGALLIGAARLWATLEGLI